jgi:hypothetical protein
MFKIEFLTKNPKNRIFWVFSTLFQSKTKERERDSNFFKMPSYLNSSVREDVEVNRTGANNIFVHNGPWWAVLWLKGKKPKITTPHC